MSGTESAFRIKPPKPPHSPEVRFFFASNPELNVPKSLKFLADLYPDVNSWVVDGGVAVQLLTGKRDLIPGDLDIVSRTDAMEDDFGHSNGLDPNDHRYIDVKSIKNWLRGRVVEPNEHSVWDNIVATSSLVDVDGVIVMVMHPAIVAAGKSTLARMTQRPKDVADLFLLNVSKAQLTAATEMLRGHEPLKQLKLLTEYSERSVTS